MKVKTLSQAVLAVGVMLLLASGARAQYLMENLGRGVVAIRQNATEVYVGWRMLGTDPAGVAFNLYRSTGGGPALQLNGAPITDSTNFVDTGADLSQSNAYFVRPVVGGTERAASATFTLPANAPAQQYLNVPLQIPAGGTTPDGVAYTYTANDASVGDLDGDGEYEIILKWDPTNAKDNSQSGYTGNVYLDGYKLDGTRLWRIDLGRNIRAGAHYTQFMVYDLDGDGKAEIACKTAPGTVDGAGQNVLRPGDNPAADYRNSGGYVLSGPEYLTVFNGLTGAAMATVSYNPPRGNVNDWGDNYGNRVDRFLAGVAYLDGKRPSLVMARGYYTRAHVAAWDFRDGQLTNRWNFDTGFSGGQYSAWRAQGAHSLTIGDVDADGKDEITYGAAAIDDNGAGLYSTNLGHGDALHMSDMDPDRPGQEVWMAHESPSQYGANGSDFRDAKTGQLIFGVSGEGADVGRGVAGDIDPNHRGSEVWSSRGGLWSSKGYNISTARPSQMNFMVWWDGDLLREIEDGTAIRKWDWTTNTSNVLLSPPGVSSNNSTKATPALLADVLGDWREEVIWRTSDNTALRIYTTVIPTQNRIYTLMHDHQYRVAVAWQNTAYNQPPHPGFYIGHDMGAVPKANIVTKLNAKIAAITSVSGDTGASATDKITNDTTLVLGGTAGANNTITLSLAGTGEIGTATADAAGNWTFDYTNVALAEGAHTFTAVGADEDGGLTPESEPFNVNVDTTAPAAPSLNSVAGSNSLVFKGTAEPGATVTVTRAGAGPVGSGVAGQNGAWTVIYASQLPQGVHTFTAAAADTAGNTSAPSSEYTVDTAVTTPLITNIVSDTGSLPNDGLTSDTTLVLNGTAAAGHTVTVSRADIGVVGAVAADGAGNWTFDYTHTALAAGTYVFNARAADGAGNNSLSSPDFVVTVEETPPVVLSINRQNPAGATINGGAVVFRVTFSEPVSGVDSSDFQLATTGSTTGAIGAAAAVSGTTYDVTVGSVSGTGTLRLDLKASGTGIVDAAGNAASGGYAAGETYTVSNNVNGTWSQTVSGGLWSGSGNWLNGAVANGAGNTADFSALNISGTNLVRLDSPRALGNFVFGDTTTSSAGSWVVDGNGNPANGFTLSVASGQPTVTVNPLGTNATATIAAPVGSAAGLTKAGTGTLVLSGANTYGGTLNVNAGALRVGTGGSLTSSGVVTAGTSSVAGSLFVDAGTASFNNGVRSSTFDGSIIRVNGGTMTAPSVTIQRNSAASVSYTSGFIVAGGSSTVGTINLGTSNSNGALSVEGGTLTATGTVTVGNQVTSGRGGGLRVTGGVFNANDTVNGVVMSRTNGSNTNNVSVATFSGGVSNVEKFTLGFDSTVNAGSATITLSNSGALYIGSGGIVKKGTSGLVTAVNLSGGTLGAAADWSTSHPLALSNIVTIKAADEADLPQDITLAGALTGAGGLTKTGTGALILSGANTYSGATTVNAGTLRVNGSVAAGGAFDVNDNGTLSGGGTISRAVTLRAGGTVSPEGGSAVSTLGAASLTWNGGGQFAFDLAAATSDRLALTGALTKGGGGPFEFVFNPAAGLAPGATYTLITFGSTNFTAADFTYSGLPSDVKGQFTVEGGALKFTLLDSVPPTLHVPADLSLEATGPAGAVATFAATAEDNTDGAVNITYSRQPGETFPLGTTVVNVTATDGAGNAAHGSFKVTVRDTAGPALTVNDVTVEATSAAGAAATYEATANDPVSGQLPVSFSIPSGSTFPLGATTVTATATDAAGNTASKTFTVTVRDTNGPVLTLPADITVEAASADGAAATFSASAADSVSGNVPVSYSPASGSTFPLGTTSVTVTATDAAGNTATGTFNVTVRDTVAPALTLPADITLEATDPNGAAASYAATASDAVSGNVSVSYSVAPGSTFALGTTAVTVTATDAAGNTATGSFNVTVRDTVAPSVECPPNVVAVAAPGASTAAVTFTINGGDAVSAVTFTSSPASGSAFPLGTTTVTATAKDAAGNTASCTFTVTVRAATTTTVAPVAAQYSDAVSLRATVAAAQVPGQPLTGNVQFFVGGTPVGTAALTNGVAELPLTLANSAAGVYDVTAQFTSTNPAFYTDGAGGPAALTVARENAATSYTGDSSLMTAGPNVTTAAVRLAARLAPEADGANFVGDITKATVTFELFKSNNLGGTPDLVVANVPVDANGDAQTAVSNLAADLYNINVKIGGANQFWTANPVGIGVLSVVVPSDEQRSTGGGWAADAASRSGKSNFGFAVTAGNKSGQAKGNFTFTLRGADGFNYVVKSNTWQDGYLQFAAEPGTSPAVYSRSNFKGRASVLKVDPSTGEVVSSAGNYAFEVFTADGDQFTPRGADSVTVTVRDANGQVWHQLGAPNSLVTLGGGNVTNKAK